MGDVITRFKLETTQFDSKLRDSAKSLTQLTQHLQIAGKDFDRFASQHVDAARSLGEVASGATNLKDKLKDLVGAYNQVAKAYNELSEEQKGTDFGKAMAESLQKLQVDIKNTKAEMNAVPGALDQLASKFTLNVDAIKLFNIGLQAAEGVLSIAKDAFFSSESNIDEWGRSVEGAKGAYDVFLQTINGGNWSDFFTNLSTAVQGARDLYDALDRLGSVKSNNQAAIAIVQQQIQQLRLAKQQGQNVDEQLKAATEQLAKLQQQAVNAGKVAGSKMSFETIRNYINANNTTGVNVNDDRLRFVVAALQRGGQNVFDKYKSEYESLGAKAQDSRLVSQTNGMGVNTSYTENYTNLQKLTEEEQRRYLIAKAITERETEIAKGLQVYSQAVQEGASSAREQFKGNRYALQGTGGSGSKATPAEQAASKFEQAQKDYQQALELATLQVKEGTVNDVDAAKKRLSAEETLWKAIGDAREVYDDPSYRTAQQQVADRVVELGGSVKQLTEQQETAKKAAQELEQAERKQAQAQEQMAKVMNQASAAWKNNDLKGAYAAQSKAAAMGGSIEIPVGFTYTQSNLDAFTQKLKQDLANADVGSLDARKLLAQLNDATMLGNIMTYAIQHGMDMTDLGEVGQNMWKRIFSKGADVAPEEFKAMLQSIADRSGKNLSITNSGSVVENKDDDIKQLVEGLNKTTSGLSSVSSGLQQLGVEIPKEVNDLLNVLNAVGSIISGVQQVISVFQVSAIVANTAAVTANTIALGVNTGFNMVAGSGLTGAGGAAAGAGAGAGAGLGGLASVAIPVAAVALAGFTVGKIFDWWSNGGIVKAADGMLIPGTSFSGDNIPAFVNAGELILNKAQQGNLASQLEGGGFQNVHLEARIEGEDIVIATGNYYSRSGYGEVVTSRN